MKKNKNMKITKDTLLADIINQEKAESVLEKHQVPCLSCPFAKLEMHELTIGQICENYGLDCEELLKDLNNDLNRPDE